MQISICQSNQDTLSKKLFIKKLYQENKTKYLIHALTEEKTLFKVVIPPNRFASITANNKNFDMNFQYGVERKIIPSLSLEINNKIYYEQLVSYRKDKEIIVKSLLLTFNYELRYYFLKTRRMKLELDANNFRGPYIAVEAGNMPMYILKKFEDYYIFDFRENNKIFSSMNTIIGLQSRLSNFGIVDAGLKLNWYYNMDIYSVSIIMLIVLGL